MSGVGVTFRKHCKPIAGCNTNLIGSPTNGTNVSARTSPEGPRSTRVSSRVSLFDPMLQEVPSGAFHRVPGVSSIISLVFPCAEFACKFCKWFFCCQMLRQIDKKAYPDRKGNIWLFSGNGVSSPGCHPSFTIIPHGCKFFEGVAPYTVYASFFDYHIA